MALGAGGTAEVESAEFIERMRLGDRVMGTSCCPAYVEADVSGARGLSPLRRQLPKGLRNLKRTMLIPPVMVGPAVCPVHTLISNLTTWCLPTCRSL